MTSRKPRPSPKYALDHTRVMLMRESKGKHTTHSVGTPRDVWTLVKDRMGSLPTEVIISVPVITGLMADQIVEVAQGTADKCLIHPRDIFIPALLSNAVGVIVAHNHPSGDLAPSKEDRQVFEALRAAGDILCIPVFDFLVITREGYYSFIEDGKYSR